MREHVLKQRSECKFHLVRKGDYPEEFCIIWNKRKVSDYKSRKDAGYAVYQIMKQEQRQKNEKALEALEAVLDDIKAEGIDYPGTLKNIETIKKALGAE